MKQLLFSLFAALFLVACGEKEKASADLYSSIPKTSVFFVETQHVVKTLREFSETKFYQEIDSIPGLLAFTYDVKEASSLFSKDSLQQLFEDRTTLITLAPSGANKFDFLFSTIADEDWEKSLLNKFKAHYTLNTLDYAGVELLEVQASTTFYFSSVNGLWLASSNKALLQESIRQINSGYSLLQEPDFAKLHETANKKEQANVYVNFQEVGMYLKHLFPQGETRFLQRVGDWVELDVELFNTELIMSGILMPTSKEPWFLKAFKGQDAQQSTATVIIPSNFSSATHYLFDNAEEWHRNYAALLAENNQATKINDFKSQVSKTLNTNSDEALLFWVDNEVGKFYTSGGNSESHTPFGFFKYRDKQEAITALEAIAEPDFIEGYRGVIIKKIAVSNPHYIYFGSLFSGFSKPYYFEFGGYILYAPNLAVIKGVINDFLTNNTLANQADFEDFTETLGNKANVMAYVASPGFLSAVKRALPVKEQATFTEQMPHYKNYNYAAVQLIVEDNAAYTNFYVEHNPPKQEKVTRLWSAVLEAPALTAPQLVVNHSNKKQEILVQDSNFKLYLIDRNGKILWTKVLDGPMLGSISQIDVFKNNKLQYAFNTNNKIYLIDRLGRDVENFPVVLKNQATAPMACFDYANNRSYRFIVPCGSELLNFGIEGKPVSGWKHTSAKTTLISKPQHFSVNKKDVITVFDADGNVYFLARNGKERFPKQMLKNVEPHLYLNPSSSLEKSTFLTHDEAGKLVSLGVKNAEERVWLDQAYPITHFAFFEDRYVYSADEHLINKSSKKPWRAELNGNISIKPKYMIFRGDFYAAAFSKNAEEISLFNKNGELVEGFPVFAQGPFDMGSLNRNNTINIVTSMEDGTLVCYAVN